jgi:hypothetical protein
MDQPPNDLPDPLKLLLNAFQAAWRVSDPSARQPAEPEAARLLRLWLQALGGRQTGAPALNSFAEGMARLLGASGAAADPLSYWTDWYERHSEALAGMLDELLRSPSFLHASARALDGYASAVAGQRRAAEQAARSLPFATHDDVTRLAHMLVALEAKIEQLAEQEEPGVGTHAEDALGQQVEALAGRLERIEAKVDRLVAAQAAPASPPRAARRRNTAASATGRTAETPPAGGASRKRPTGHERQVRLLGGGPAR